jgi:hypothetical protein
MPLVVPDSIFTIFLFLNWKLIVFQIPTILYHQIFISVALSLPMRASVILYIFYLCGNFLKNLEILKIDQ